MNQDWMEPWIDQMGWIVALSGEARFRNLEEFKKQMRTRLTKEGQVTLKEAIRQRFTPTNGQDGCRGAIEAVREATV